MNVIFERRIKPFCGRQS
ncbi:hypothetical protein ACS0PU_005029, partial [Formica fusca]